MQRGQLALGVRHMTVQADRPTGRVPISHGSASRRRRRISAAAVAALAAGGTAAGLVVSSGGDHPGPPRPVLGQSLTPLAVYPVVIPQAARPAAGQQLVPDMGRPGHSTVLGSKPVMRLHIRYARVRPVTGHWLIEMTAPEGASFNARTTQANSTTW
ncbi:MAG TPA: hypothetical protein VFH66_14430 [Mycobacteriales bacterium]|nr:hypothetical protein [Mycobacteriales bacterium]